MKVVILGPYKVIGGVATVVEEIAEVFAKKGAEVTLISLEATSLPPKYPNIKVITPKPLDRGGRLGKILAIFQPKFLIDLFSYLQREEYDLVISNLYYSIFLAWAKAKTKVHIMHGMGHHISGWLRANVGNYSNILGARFADTTIANSYLTAAINETIFGINSVVVPLGVSPPQQIKNLDLSLEQRSIDILYVGRLIAAKSIPTLLEAVAILNRNRQEQLNLHILGKGVELDNLKLRAEELNIQQRVTFHGYVPRQELAQYYLQAKCFVSLNPTEPFGLTYLEALACGTPIVLCRGSGFSPFCDPHFTALVDFDPPAIAEGIDRILATKIDRHEISQQTLEDFSWERTVSSILKALPPQEEKIA
jgi:glycosyltransferase involved in cell wall biosynthesis